MGMGCVVCQWPPQILVLGEMVSTGPHCSSLVNSNDEGTEDVQLGRGSERLLGVECASLFSEEPESQTSQ